MPNGAGGEEGNNAAHNEGVQIDVAWGAWLAPPVPPPPPMLINYQAWLTAQGL